MGISSTNGSPASSSHDQYQIKKMRRPERERDGSEVKKTCNSCRGPKFGSHPPWGGSLLSPNSSVRCPLQAPLGTRNTCSVCTYIHTYILVKHPHTFKKTTKSLRRTTILPHQTYCKRGLNLYFYSSVISEPSIRGL